MAMPPISGIVLIGTLHEVGPWLRAHDDLGLVLYVVAFTVLGGLALLPTYAQSLLGGWAFGLVFGLSAALNDATGGPETFFVDSAVLVPSPVPEPSTWVLTLAGLGAIGFVVRQRRRR